MIYFYTVRLRYWINDNYVFKDYRLSFAEIADFLYEKQQENSSMEIYWIKPYYKKGCDYFD